MVTTQTDHISQVFAQRQDAAPSLGALRQRAFDRFHSLGWPSTKDEAWRFTNPRAIAQTPFQMQVSAPADLDEAFIKSYFVEDQGLRLVFVDGEFHNQLSQLEGLPQGCQLERLSKAVGKDHPEVQQALNQFQAHAAQMGSLNSAFWGDGVWLSIAPDTDLEKPIQIIHVQTKGHEPSMVHPRVIVSGGRHSRGKLVETFLGSPEASYWVNNVTQVHLADGAHFTHYLAQFNSESAYHTANLNAQLHRHSKLTCHHMLIGSKLMRNNINIHLRGEGGSCDINGLTLGHESQVLDNHVEMNHIVPHCDSSQYFKTILDDKAHGVFGGRVVVFQEAQKTDAKQTNRNLLLSDHARIDTKPQLEIYADDVKCAHGATTGQLDRDAMFYLASRGLDPKSAREVMLYAFAHEILDRLDVPALLDQVEKVLLSRFTQSHLLGA